MSSSAQGRLALGLEAQRQALERFAASEGSELVSVIVEFETGKGADALDRRPKLVRLLPTQDAAAAPVAVAKLDRLSRDGQLLEHSPSATPPPRHKTENALASPQESGRINNRSLDVRFGS